MPRTPCRRDLLIVQDGIIMLANDALPDMLRVPADYLEVGKHWSIAVDHLRRSRRFR